MFLDTFHLFNKYMRITMRMPLWSLFTLIQPLIWLIIFGQLFKDFVNLENGNYMDYMIPGILVMTVLFGSSWSGVSLLREITAGSIDKMLVSPVSRVAIVLSRVLHSAVQVMAQCLVILLISVLLGASLDFNLIYLLPGLLIIFLLGVGFASLSNGFAITIQREEPLVMIGNLMTLPLLFFSSAFVPEAIMPSWIKFISTINPISYAIDSLRALMTAQPIMDTFMTGFLVVLGFAAVTLWWAVSAFNASRD